MQNIKHILLVLNSTSAAAVTAVRYCQQIAEAMQARVTVVDVLRPITDRWSNVLRSKYDLDAGKAFCEERTLELEQFLKSHNADWPVKVERGAALIEISKLALETHCDLVVKPQLDEDSQTFGSLAKQLVRKCPTAVLLVKPSEKGQLQNIMTAIDPEPSFPEQQKLNQSVLSLGHTISSKLKGSLTVVSAWHIFGESYLRSPRINLTDAQYEELEQDEKTLHKKMLIDLGESIGIKLNEQEVLLSKGLPYLAISYAVKQAKTDILVMGSIGRVGVPGLLIGNTAERIIDSVKCSVLTVKPPGYISPLKL